MEKNKKHKVVFQLSNNDTFVQKSLIRQLSNLLAAMDDISVEVVTHSYGIDLLLEDSPFKNNIKILGNQGVDFLICGNTINHDKLDRSAFPVKLYAIAIRIVQVNRLRYTVITGAGEGVSRGPQPVKDHSEILARRIPDC